MRAKWAEDWETQRSEIGENHKKLHKIVQEHEDIELKREELEEKVQAV